MLQITFIDILLLVVYIILLEVMMRLVNRVINKDNKELAGYFLNGFRLKIFFGIAFAIFSVFALPADTRLYFSGGIDFKKIIFDSIGNLRFLTAPAMEFSEFYEAKGFTPENYGYVSSAGNLMAMKFVALFSIVSFDSYIVVSLFFSTFSFFGLWFMFKCFYKIYPSLYKIIFMTFFLVPSVLFWGSGILKDTLCIGFLGIGFYNAYLFLFQKQYSVKVLCAFVVSFYCLFVLKSYIAVSFLGLFTFWYLLQMLSRVKNYAAKVACIVIPGLVFILYLFFGNFKEIVANYSLEAVAENMQTTQRNYFLTTPDDGAFIDYGEITPTLSGMARIVPKALVASLFRPFIWEAKKITSFIAALEGTFFFLLTLYVFLRKGLMKSLLIIFTDSTITFCFLFSIVFAIAIGLNCFNLGTLVRYKIPCLPFYLLSLILILKKQQEKSPGLVQA